MQTHTQNLKDTLGALNIKKKGKKEVVLETTKEHVAIQSFDGMLLGSHFLTYNKTLAVLK